MDSPKTVLLKKTLTNYGASLTKPRLIVFNLLDQPTPQSMSQLRQASLGLLDKASLYRTINLFESLSIANRINNGFKYKLELSDDFNHHHHHLTCMTCNRIINTEEDRELENLIKKLATAHNFDLTAHQLEIQGQCSECRLSQKASA